MARTSVVFITKGGPYPDEWLNEAENGLRAMRWYGQNRHRRDWMVGPGTHVAVREKKTSMEFKLIGTVESIERVVESAARGTPHEYRMVVRLSEDPVTIERAGDDRFTHWAMLRYLLIPYTNAGVAEGIYST